jgi:hypothetical protein
MVFPSAFRPLPNRHGQLATTKDENMSDFLKLCA